MAKTVAEIAKIVERACATETNVLGYGIWTHHIKKVAETARFLAADFGADPEIVEIAALLHDYASVKDEKLYNEHHIHGPIEAERILTELDYPIERIEAVKHCIAGHRASVEVKRRTAEAECLANAMVHIENVPSLLHFVYVTRGMGIDEGALWVTNKLRRSWKKLSPDMQDKMRKKFTAALETLMSIVEWPDDFSAEDYLQEGKTFGGDS